MDEAAEALGSALGDELLDDEDQEETEAPESDDTSEETDTEEVSEDSEDDADAVEDDEPVTLDSLNAVAEHIGIPIEDLMSIPATFKAAGEDVTATLTEIQQGYARGADYRRQTGDLQKERDSLRSEYEEKSQGLMQSGQLLGALSEHLTNVVAGEMDSPQMQALKQTDITKWTAAVTEINTRKEGIQKVQTNLAQMLQQQQAALDAEAQERLEALAKKESEALLERVPEWSQDQDKAITDNLVNHYGFSPEEIVGQIYDHRMILVARDAMRYRQAKAQEQKTVKKVTKLPKVAKPGKAPPKSGKSRKLAKAMSTHRKEKSVKSAADAIGQKLDRI